VALRLAACPVGLRPGASRPSGTEHYAVRVFAEALSNQEEWWEHVAAVRAGATPLDLVRRHRYARGHRAQVVAEFLRRAAAAPSETPAGRPTKELAKFAMVNASVCGWADDAPP
jgi:hypothetical protein